MKTFFLVFAQILTKSWPDFGWRPFIFGLHLISGPGLGKEARYQSLYPLTRFLSKALYVANGLPPLRYFFERSCVIYRGGVEDTRLEAKAKAKDTKKIRGQGQGQGQPFRGQNLSRPRTGMLEAKAKDQGHRRKCSPKKKKSSKIFCRRSPIRCRTKNLLG